MSGTPITSTETQLIIVKHVATKALQALKANTIMTRLVNRSYEDIFASSGDTVNVPIPPLFQVNDLADGNSVNIQNPTHDRTQIVLNQHKYVSMQLTDVARVLTTPNLMEMDIGQAILNLAEQIDASILQTAYAGFTFNTPVGAFGVNATEATVLAARKALADAKVPKNQKHFGVVSTSFYNDLLGISRFSEYQTRGPAAAAVGSPVLGGPDNVIGGEMIATGAVGQIHGIDWYENQLVPVTGGNQTHNIVFTRDALLFAQRALPQAEMGTGALQSFVQEDNMAIRVTLNYNSDVMAYQLTLDTLFGVGIGRNQFGVEVRS